MSEKIDHSIDVRYEPDVIKAFNKFIKKWCGNWYPHLIDSDEQDGQFMREKIENIQRDTREKDAVEIEKIIDEFGDNPQQALSIIAERTQLWTMTDEQARNYNEGHDY
jgi:hypothetical protein